MRSRSSRRFLASTTLIVALALIPSSGLAPLAAQEPAGDIERNVVYGIVGGAALLMDVHHPAEPNGVGLVWIWGSGWQAGEAYEPYGMGQLKNRGVPPEVLELGYTVFVLNVRGTPMFRYPAPVHDAQRAARFIRHHAERWGIDPDRLGGWGGSSGAHLVSMLATMDGEGRPDANDPVERESSKLQAVVARAAPTDLGRFPNRGGIGQLVSFMGVPVRPGNPRFREASPVTYASPDDPPILLVHGDADMTVPYEQSEFLFAALQAQGVTTRLIRVPGGDHGANDALASYRWFNEHLLTEEQAAAMELRVAAMEPMFAARERLEEGMRAATEGRIEDALDALEAAPRMHPSVEIEAGHWNWVCWQGGLWNQPERVVHACDRAVELNPDHREYRDSRGLVRALLGDFEGAIEDFEFFIERVPPSNPRRAQRQGWVEALRAGENPFSEDVLAELRGG
jgi:acetyl esterase/lipase